MTIRQLRRIRDAVMSLVLLVCACILTVVSYDIVDATVRLLRLGWERWGWGLLLAIIAAIVAIASRRARSRQGHAQRRSAADR